jgi:PadR family transcriptional regulator, regulatory protein PadR
MEISVIPEPAGPNGEEGPFPGTLSMLILKTLDRGALHGAAVAETIHRLSEHTLKVEEGALYPALHRLESRGLLESEWGFSESKRRAKFYRLTAAGMKELAEENAHWRRMTEAIRRVMETA